MSLSICFVTRANASSISLSWDPSPDPTVTGYNIYYGDASGHYTNVVPVVSATNAVISGLVEDQTYYFAATAFDMLGDESDFSNEIEYLVPGILTLTPGATPSDPMQIRFPVVPGKQYQLQVSEDLQSWSNISQITAVSNIWMEVDDPQTGLPQRFYRLLSN